jgi:uncharacterized membrane protein YgdD (TMEM256/DUF423 family)
MTAIMSGAVTPMVLIALAGLMGAAGVILLAAGAHAAPGAGLDSAGATLFSADIAVRAFAGHRLFPFAAPSGGFILIASWLAVVAAAVIALARG